jgi:adenylate cyclase
VAAKLPRVLCLPRGHVVGVGPGETLLAAARRLDVPLASSCGGKAVCGDCIVRVVSGAEHLTPPDADEIAWRARTGKGSEALRLACCLRVTGPAEVATTYW